MNGLLGRWMQWSIDNPTNAAIGGACIIAAAFVMGFAFSPNTSKGLRVGGALTVLFLLLTPFVAHCAGVL